MEHAQTALVFFFGSILGSFLNVCIYRLPRKKSIVWPVSYCPQCKKSIPLTHQIPLVSYLILGGKCRNCKSHIPIRYPVVEFLTGLLLVLIWRHYGFGAAFLHYSILILFLLPISFIDLDTKLILNVLTFPGLVIGMLSSLFLRKLGVSSVVAGVLLGGGFLWLVGILGKGMFKQDSMGGGDIKLGAMVGAFLGPKVVVALFLSFFIALPVIAIGLGTRKLRMGSTVPFGPFISLATVILICFGQTLFLAYARLTGF